MSSFLLARLASPSPLSGAARSVLNAAAAAPLLLPARPASSSRIHHPRGKSLSNKKPSASKFTTTINSPTSKLRRFVDVKAGSSNSSSSHDGDDPSSKSKSKDSSATKMFKPVPVKPNPDDIDLGHEISGGRLLDRQDLLRTLNTMFRSEQIRKACKQQGLDDYLFQQAYISFRKFCMDVRHLPPDLYVLISDILQKSRHPDDLLPSFLLHARKVFPHLECLDDLRMISDLTNPPNWYPDARALNRKFVFHAGPTNSGKTYHALERFMSAKSGVYCGPLKMLAVEVFNKLNERGVPCDLVTGEERKYAREDGEPSNHVACTVEMTNFNANYEVAVIDEIQMMKDKQRGWAWTRALLGTPADEIHLCGEPAAVDLVQEILIHTGETLESRHYKRLTNLIIEKEGVSSLERVQPGDCIVCFNKNDIYTVSRGLERLGVECAVIYGSLPPGTKLAMAAKFNNPDDPCKVLVATDAIGMGLNLNIRRIIFYSMTKMQLMESGEKEMDVISVSQALQIAGRAGRFNTQWETGYATCFHHEEMNIMRQLLNSKPETLLRAGLHPTFDQIELYAYHLPHATLTNLVDIFISLSTLDDNCYMLCQMDDFKFLADMLEHVKLPLKAKYNFCCAPINRRMPFVCTMFLKMARQFSRGELLTFDWLCHQVGWPFSPPDTILDLVHLEAVHDVFDVYLWLSYRFPDMFPDVELVRSVQSELDKAIEAGVAQLVQLLRNSESGTSSGAARVINDQDFEAKTRKQGRFKRWDHGEEARGTSKAKGKSAAKWPNGKKREQIDFSSILNKNNKEEELEGDLEDDDEEEDSGEGLKKGSDGGSKELNWQKDKSGGHLSAQLVEQGLLTQNMLQQLQREWAEKTKRDDGDGGEDGK